MEFRSNQFLGAAATQSQGPRFVSRDGHRECRPDSACGFARWDAARDCGVFACRHALGKPRYRSRYGFVCSSHREAIDAEAPVRDMPALKRPATEVAVLRRPAANQAQGVGKTTAEAAWAARPPMAASRLLGGPKMAMQGAQGKKLFFEFCFESWRMDLRKRGLLARPGVECCKPLPLSADPAMNLFWKACFKSEEDPTTVVAIQTLTQVLNAGLQDQTLWQDADPLLRLRRLRAAVVSALWPS